MKGLEYVDIKSAGTLRHAELKPELPSTFFPRARAQNLLIEGRRIQGHTLAKPRNGTQGREGIPQRSQDNEFDDQDLDDNDLINVDCGTLRFGCP